MTRTRGIGSRPAADTGNYGATGNWQRFKARAESPNNPGRARRFRVPDRVVSRVAGRGFPSVEFQRPRTGAEGVDRFGRMR